MKKASPSATAVAMALLLGGCSGKDTVEPSATPGDLALVSVPAAARVQVDRIRDGEEVPFAHVEATPDTLRGLSEGSYLLRFNLSGYAELDTVVLVEAGGLKVVEAWLQELSVGSARGQTGPGLTRCSISARETGERRSVWPRPVQ
ncbi:MAG: hypothetical protein IPK64_18410 [bacterium]|nr:hypothetical protein [bacterium]